MKDVCREPTMEEPTPKRPYVSDNSVQSLVSLLKLAQQGWEEVARDPQQHQELQGILPVSVMNHLWSAFMAGDPNSAQHARRVAYLARGLASHLGWEGKPLKILEVAALLHDIGKLGVPENIRNKPGKLSPDERELICLHYNVALNVLQICRVHPHVLEFIGNSQATVMGWGSPLELWKTPSLGARILAVVDAYDSLQTEHPWRPAHSHQEIIEVLSAQDSEFDENIIRALDHFLQQQGMSPPPPPESMLDDNGFYNAQWLTQVMAQLYHLESLYDGYYVVDQDLRYIVWNPGIESLLGHCMLDLLGQSWNGARLGYQTERGGPLAEELTPLIQVVQDKIPRTAELPIARHDGRVIRVELQTIPLLDEHGSLQGVLEIFRDRTRSHRRTPQALRELRQAAARDALTSLANRGELEARLADLLMRVEVQQDDPFSVIFLDVDYFKSINDTYGHATGDRVLIDLARLLRHETYCGEIIGRYGGEEFVLLCPGTNLETAVRRAERLRFAIRSSKIGGFETPRVTASFGVTQWEEGDTADTLLRRADQALYLAKQAGRDRTWSLSRECSASEEGPTDATAPQQPFCLEYEFETVHHRPIFIVKLGGFVEDYGVEIRHVTPEQVILHLGSSGWFGRWGKTPDKQPIELLLKLPPDNDGPYKPRRRVKVIVRPRGRIRDPQLFQQRSWQVLRELRSYILGDSIESVTS